MIIIATITTATIIPMKAPVVKPQQIFVSLSWFNIVNTSLDVSLQFAIVPDEEHPPIPQVLLPLNYSISQGDKLLAWQGAFFTNLEITYY